VNARVDLPPAREVCSTTTRRLIADGALLVDVRERAEIDRLAFDLSDLVIMPLSELELRVAELPRDRALVLACQSGPRSLKATYFLMRQGYEHVASLEGGIFKWASKGFPIKGPPVATTTPAAEAVSAGECGSDSGASGKCGSSGAGTGASACCETAATASGKCC